MDTAHHMDYKCTPDMILAIALGDHGGPETNINMYRGSLIPLIIAHKSPITWPVYVLFSCVTLVILSDLWTSFQDITALNDKRQLRSTLMVINGSSHGMSVY